MNAEFLEKDIIVTEDDGAYAAGKRRKGMDPYAFMGVIVKTADNKEAYAIVSAVEATGTIEVVAGPYTLTYTIATGELAVTKA